MLSFGILKLKLYKWKYLYKGFCAIFPLILTKLNVFPDNSGLSLNHCVSMVLSSDPTLAPSASQLCDALPGHKARDPPCVLGAQKAFLSSMLLLGCFYWNAISRVARDFGIMNVTAHRHCSISLYPPFCLHSLRE